MVSSIPNHEKHSAQLGLRRSSLNQKVRKFKFHQIPKMEIIEIMSIKEPTHRLLGCPRLEQMGWVSRKSPLRVVKVNEKRVVWEVIIAQRGDWPIIRPSTDIESWKGSINLGSSNRRVIRWCTMRISWAKISSSRPLLWITSSLK